MDMREVVVLVFRWSGGALSALLLAACVGAAPARSAIDPGELPVRARFTVLVFYSPTCHCLQTHDARLIALSRQYEAQGVKFVLVDSEVRGDEAADEAEGKRRGYPFPIVRDRGAKLARELGAEYATYSVLLDDEGRVLYRGGIDSDKDHLHDDAQPYLRDAIDDVLARRPPRLPVSKTLGCSLETW